MPKVSLTTVAGAYYSTTELNNNFTTIQNYIENLISRNGDAPNYMEADLDLNSNRITNLLDPVDPQDAATKQYVLDNTVAGAVAACQAAQAAAELAQAGAEAAYDSFDDRYLGSKAVAPTVDNDGNPLIEGAIYWNSVTKAMYSWTGSVWDDFTTSVSGRVLKSGDTMTGDLLMSSADVDLDGNNLVLSPDALSYLNAAVDGTVNLYVDSTKIADATQKDFNINGNLVVKVNTTTGTSSAYVLDSDQSVGSGVILVKMHSTNGSTAPTLKVGSAAPLPIRTLDSGVLRIGDIKTNMVAMFIYGGSYWYLCNPIRPQSYYAENLYGTGSPNALDGVLDVDALWTPDTWESVGPTGSGADHTWTALNDVPTDVDWIEVRGGINAHNTASGTSVFNTLYARAYGATIGIGNSTLIGRAYAEDSGGSSCYDKQIFTAKIPASARRFELRFGTNTGNREIEMYVTGWGWN